MMTYPGLAPVFWDDLPSCSNDKMMLDYSDNNLKGMRKICTYLSAHKY